MNLKLKFQNNDESAEIEITSSGIMLSEINAALINLSIKKKWNMWREMVQNGGD